MNEENGFLSELEAEGGELLREQGQLLLDAIRRLGKMPGNDAFNWEAIRQQAKLNRSYYSREGVAIAQLQRCVSYSQM